MRYTRCPCLSVVPDNCSLPSLWRFPVLTEDHLSDLQAVFFIHFFFSFSTCASLFFMSNDISVFICMAAVSGSGIYTPWFLACIVDSGSVAGEP